MGKKSKKEKNTVPPNISESFAKKWAAFANGDGTYKIQEIYTFAHMWYSRLDIQKKCKEILLTKKLGDAEMAEKLHKVLLENSSAGKDKEKEYASVLQKTNWMVILNKMKEMIKQGG